MLINIHGRLIDFWGCGCFNYSYFNGNNCCQFNTTINRLPKIDIPRRTMPCLIGMLGLSLMGRIRMHPIPILLVWVIWLFIVWIRLSRSTEDRQLPLLILYFPLKHRNIGLPPLLTIISTPPNLDCPTDLEELLHPFILLRDLRKLYLSLLLSAYH